MVCSIAVGPACSSCEDSVGTNRAPISCSSVSTTVSSAGRSWVLRASYVPQGHLEDAVAIVATFSNKTTLDQTHDIALRVVVSLHSDNATWTRHTHNDQTHDIHHQNRYQNPVYTIISECDQNSSPGRAPQVRLFSKYMGRCSLQSMIGAANKHSRTGSSITEPQQA
jgi:hypothetical protein